VASVMKEPLETVAGAGHRLGDYIRDQRNNNQISLRQLATLAGVSNPYLSQIERGLRKPSAEILQQIAKALRISSETLYVQAGILEPREGTGAVVDALFMDEHLTERQKHVLLEIYESFCKENAHGDSSMTADPGAPEHDARHDAQHDVRTPSPESLVEVLKAHQKESPA
jgi:transcriptional regulator with XRE-family HTH domain